MELDSKGNVFLSTPSARRATGAVTTSVETLQEFLSTPSARRATEPLQLPPGKAGNFYPRPPRGGRRAGCAGLYQAPDISIHALREEGDVTIRQFLDFLCKFLSTPSARRATTCCRCGAACRNHFYPRPPRGGRHADKAVADRLAVISIHALREEGDHSAMRPVTSGS